MTQCHSFRLRARLLALSLAALASTVAAAPPESIDPALYCAIRTQGLEHSQAMAYAVDLADGIGARLMGSPNLRRAYGWSLDTLAAIGASGGHLEDTGEFGLSWRLDNAWMRMAAPDAMVFVVQAAPWSVATPGAVQGDAIAVTIANDQDIERYRGKLAHKIVFLGPLREVAMPLTPLAIRLSDAELASGAAVGPVAAYYAHRAERMVRKSEQNAFNVRLSAFFDSEHILGLVRPSPDGDHGGGTGNLVVDNGAMLTLRPWDAGDRPAYPVVVAAIEHFGRVWRLLQKQTPVQVQFQVDSAVLGAHEHGANVVAEIPGSDPSLAGQYVLVGAHLDSWAAGTGAVDNGAGVAIALEVMRIIMALPVAPRRTVRIVLFTGEEEGLFGSLAYAKRHLGTVPRSTAPDQLLIPVEGWRKATGPVQRGPEYGQLAAFFNLDSGSGKIRAIATGGNPALAAILRQWMAPLHDLGAGTVFDLPYWPADQSSITDLGLPGLIFVQDGLDYDSRAHHSNMDTVERLVPADLAQAATVQATLVMQAANLDQMLPRTH